MPIDRDAALKNAEKFLRQGKLEAAIAEYVRLTAAHPGDWASINALGDLYVRTGDVDRAVTQFAHVGDHLVRQGALTKAAAVYRKIIRISPGDTRGTRGLALVAGKQDAARPPAKGQMPAEDPEARMLAAREAQDSSDVPRACALLIEAADLYQAQGRESDALAAVAEASSIAPGNVEYRARLLRMLIAQGELAQARYVARVVPELVMVADAFQRDGRTSEALDTMSEAALVEPQNQALRERVIRQFIASGDLDRARQFSRTPAELLLVADALTGENRGAEVLDVVTEAVEREPHNPDLRVPLVTASLAAGDLERARAAARTSHDWMLLAQAMRAQGRFRDALAAMREATQRDPHDAALHADFVRGCLSAGDLQQARQSARTKAEIVEVANALDARGDASAALQMRADALRRDPEDPELRLRLIRDYIGIGDRDRAHALLTLAVAGDDAELLMLLGRLEFQIGRLDEARRALDRLLESHPDRTGEVLALGKELIDTPNADGAFICVEAVADRATGQGEWSRAASALEEFSAGVPFHAPALLKLIEVYVEGGQGAKMTRTQERLVDAYLHAGRGSEARLIAEDLVMRAPWERSSVERLVRALMLCHDPEPEQTIAELLCGDISLMVEKP